MENKLNINNLRTFVEALNKLPTEIKNNEVYMQSSEQPVCGTVGCHGGLISIVSEYIPELRSLYSQDYVYSYFTWAQTLAKFLGFDNKYELEEWANNNPELWGNYYGFGMFGAGLAFGQKTDNFKHSVIIKHWTGVLHRVEESNKGKSNEKQTKYR